MTDYSVKIPFSGKDYLSSQIKTMRSNMSKFGTTSHSVFNRMKKDSLSVKKIIGGILGARAVTAGISAVKNQINDLTDEVIKLDSASVAAAARFGFSKQDEEFKKITKEARNVGAVTRYTAGEAAE